MPYLEKGLPKLLPCYFFSENTRNHKGSRGYTEAKGQVEMAIRNAAMLVVQGLKALYLEGSHADLAPAAYTRSGLDDMRGPSSPLENLCATAHSLATALAKNW
ncbi:hypothetical protein [Hymenobacter cheonanensis]|uniref:hypothetical protein n=1 Tax=Hymenobacter sp. CA2-7 TaxID=3063993 RepID=UPI002713B8DF|nr:hypothetical protein [Hymenobacter sp. CA2-7]MDO7886100.1 hypothetical protein [Hymenobacter sp. CA2-7]